MFVDDFLLLSLRQSGCSTTAVMDRHHSHVSQPRYLVRLDEVWRLQRGERFHPDRDGEDDDQKTTSAELLHSPRLPGLHLNKLLCCIVSLLSVIFALNRYRSCLYASVEILCQSVWNCGLYKVVTLGRR